MFVFEPDDWVWIPGEHYNSDLKSNPSKEEENDATLVSMQTTITDPGRLKTKVRDERAEAEERACRSSREEGEATKMSN